MVLMRCHFNDILSCTTNNPTRIYRGERLWPVHVISSKQIAAVYNTLNVKVQVNF